MGELKNQGLEVGYAVFRVHDQAALLPTSMPAADYNKITPQNLRKIKDIRNLCNYIVKHAQIQA